MSEEENASKLLSGTCTVLNKLVSESVNLPFTEFTFKIEEKDEGIIKREIELVISCLEKKLKDKFVVFAYTVLGFKTCNGFTLTKKKPNPEKHTLYDYHDVYLLRAQYAVFDSPEDYLDYLEKRGSITIGGVR